MWWCLCFAAGGRPNVDLTLTLILKVNPHRNLETLANKILAGWHISVHTKVGYLTRFSGRGGQGKRARGSITWLKPPGNHMWVQEDMHLRNIPCIICSFVCSTFVGGLLIQTNTFCYCHNFWKLQNSSKSIIEMPMWLFSNFVFDWVCQMSGDWQDLESLRWCHYCFVFPVAVLVEIHCTTRYTNGAFSSHSPCSKSSGNRTKRRQPASYMAQV